MNKEFNTNARSNIFEKSKYPTGFDKVVSSGIFSSYFFQVIFPLMLEFIVPRILVPRKHYHTMMIVFPRYKPICFPAYNYLNVFFNYPYDFS